MNIIAYAISVFLTLALAGAAGVVILLPASASDRDVPDDLPRVIDAR